MGGGRGKVHPFLKNELSLLPSSTLFFFKSRMNLENDYYLHRKLYSILLNTNFFCCFQTQLVVYYITCLQQLVFIIQVGSQHIYLWHLLDAGILHSAQLTHVSFLYGACIKYMQCMIFLWWISFSLEMCTCI